jgi:hypothetical protein
MVNIEWLNEFVFKPFAKISLNNLQTSVIHYTLNIEVAEKYSVDLFQWKAYFRQTIVSIDHLHRANNRYSVEDSQRAVRIATSSAARVFSFGNSHPKQTWFTLNKAADAIVSTFAPFARLCLLIVWLRNTGCSSAYAYACSVTAWQSWFSLYQSSRRSWPLLSTSG